MKRWLKKITVFWGGYHRISPSELNRQPTCVNIRESVVSLSFIFPDSPEDVKKEKKDPMGLPTGFAILSVLWCPTSEVAARGTCQVNSLVFSPSIRSVSTPHFHSFWRVSFTLFEAVETNTRRRGKGKKQARTYGRVIVKSRPHLTFFF